jgi:hypothetical protein
MKKLSESLKAVLGACGSAVATITGSGIDTKGYNAAMVVLTAGSFTSTGTLAAKIQHSDDDGSSDNYADISGAAFTSLTDSTDLSVQVGHLKLDGNNVKRYIRVVTVVGTAAAPHAVTVVLSGEQYGPAESVVFTK